MHRTALSSPATATFGSASDASGGTGRHRVTTPILWDGCYAKPRPVMFWLSWTTSGRLARTSASGGSGSFARSSPFLLHANLDRRAKPVENWHLQVEQHQLKGGLACLLAGTAATATPRPPPLGKQRPAPLAPGCVTAAPQRSPAAG